MNCINCNQPFTVTKQDLAFYEKVSPIIASKKFLLKTPQICHPCREQNRIAFRNEKKLYQRKCDLCKKEIISVYSPDKNHVVYCNNCWWSDSWECTSTGREYDFSKPFFQQFSELLATAPILALFAKNNVNSDYVNQETDDKNCYLNAGGHFNEDCYYNTYAHRCKNVMDNYWTFRCELCYMCVHSDDCFNSTYLQNCNNVRDSHYSKECKNCEYCFGCYGLSHKKYCFFNEQLTPEAYTEKVAAILPSRSEREKYQQLAVSHFLKYPHEATKMYTSEDSDGEMLMNCKNVHNAFNIEIAEDSKDLVICAYLKDCQDISAAGWAELCYQITSSMKSYQLLFASHCAEVKDALYTIQSFNCDHLFGCIGLYRKSYCILNKQYTKEAYEALVPRIIEHMQSTDEWSQFFPMAMSPFAYNETVAQEYFPLTKATVEQKGLHWQDHTLMNRYEGPQITIPDHIDQVTDEILKQILSCTECQKNYKVIQQELEFYRQRRIPASTLCLDCRHKYRLALKTPNCLYDRNCQGCQKEIKTPYAPERKEIVYCNGCYQEAITNL